MSTAQQTFVSHGPSHLGPNANMVGTNYYHDQQQQQDSSEQLRYGGVKTYGGAQSSVYNTTNPSITTHKSEAVVVPNSNVVQNQGLNDGGNKPSLMDRIKGHHTPSSHSATTVSTDTNTTSTLHPTNQNDRVKPSLMDKILPGHHGNKNQHYASGNGEPSLNATTVPTTHSGIGGVTPSGNGISSQADQPHLIHGHGQAHGHGLVGSDNHHVTSSFSPHQNHVVVTPSTTGSLQTTSTTNPATGYSNPYSENTTTTTQRYDSDSHHVPSTSFSHQNHNVVVTPSTAAANHTASTTAPTTGYSNPYAQHNTTTTQQHHSPSPYGKPTMTDKIKGGIKGAVKGFKETSNQNRQPTVSTGY
ncbi:hypothetical protein IE53DRAFT_19062 [Violaceomyces palustris]|uniref:Uncharacterized protein n=1 Tax=Violaceomyces palustris TaxID=1673888 RepID=A0ACD0P1Y4_9BASI|nr:hypothetical protein IE53DRAFT_19062 [Violaceomyces palustris]